MKLRTISMIMSALVAILLQSQHTLAATRVNASDIAKALITPETSISIGKQKYLINRQHPALGPIIPKNAITAQNITIVSRSWQNGNLVVEYTSNKKHKMVLTPLTPARGRR